MFDFEHQHISLYFQFSCSVFIISNTLSLWFGEKFCRNKLNADNHLWFVLCSDGIDGILYMEGNGHMRHMRHIAIHIKAIFTFILGFCVSVC